MLLGFCAGDGGGDAKSDERAAGDVFLNTKPTEIGAEPVGERTGEHGPATVTEQAQQSERAAEEEDLSGDVSARCFHELGEEGEEEERGFGIEKVDEDSLTENAGEAVRYGRRDDLSVCAAYERTNTEENQIKRAGKLNEVKGARGRDENRREAEGSGGGMNQSADGDAGGGDYACFAALADGAAENVEDGRPGNEEENESAGEK